MAHTPGPWISKGDEVWAGNVHIADCLRYAANDDYYETHDTTPGNDEDNATLAAAAPEMLAALESCEWIGGTGSAGQFCPFCRGLYPTHKSDCKRQVAITKTKGETTT